MRHLAFFVTAAGFSAVFLGTIVASVTLTAAPKGPVQPQLSILAN